ncbi:alpha-galactosidase [Anaeromicropila herbilytica]|uniref:alpha-galactosidase n=1 Tax=Anaeromicropila herbilytica TaxID=2785025 RepID=A0A7R7ICP8_9FIRM|nr:alpha-galactosidase [Anaeromicropila herbilytica]BCN30096.1 alpha-galactosidase [Anaeromicropila herbilytica]
MISRNNNYFLFDTNHTTYAFRVMESGQLEHIYYGNRLNIDMKQENMNRIFEPFIEKKKFLLGNSISYSKEQDKIGLEDLCLEMSSYGKGDIREPFIEIVYPDGSCTSDFIFESASIRKWKDSLKTLPSSYAYEKQVEELNIVLKERNHDLRLHLNYSVYPECDVIVRSSKLINGMNDVVKVKRLMSTQLDFEDSGFVFTSFTGAWIREMNRSDHTVTSGIHVNQTMAGFSSSRANPFVMISSPDTTESYGDCYACNLIYSGNHYEALEVNPYGKSRFVSGINPRGFLWKLNPDDEFEAPEAVMTYSSHGWEELSHRMHEFVREHIVRGEWKYKERPVLLNSWEAAYFDFNESKLLKLAKSAKDLGVELFVMDDGWFGKRDNDTSSLGDWNVNKKKLPGGIKGIADKVNALGLDFGIWVEPEMVNEDSNCYREHPDWAVKIPGQDHSLGRNQMFLDLTRKEVREYVIDSMTNVFADGNISYVKWDMNRIFSDAYSVGLPAECQGEFYHRYVLGLYEVISTLVERFPKVLFEGCASGGNRFDLGMLCYMPQIWASDNTDAICRMTIQQGYSYGYPLSVISAHVSDVPNHQTLRKTPLSTRYHVACYGILGYECNLTELSKDDQNVIREQISIYKEWRKVFQFGDFYRIKDGSVIDQHKNPTGSYQWLSVSKDKNKAVLMDFQSRVIPNLVYNKVHTRGLAEEKEYHFYNIAKKINIKEFGDLVNTVSPIHIKKESITQHVVSKFVKLDEEKEDYIIQGVNLNRLGVRLKQSFGATGYNDQVRYYPDYATRMYFMESVE